MQKIKPQDHKHDCFAEAKKTAENIGGRVGHFIYVGNNDVDDAHYLGNTAFAGGVLLRLVNDVIGNHESNGCEQCDRVALALAAAKRAFVSAMQGAPGEC